MEPNYNRTTSRLLDPGWVLTFEIAGSQPESRGGALVDGTADSDGPPEVVEIDVSDKAEVIIDLI